jgi:DNA mismatch repair protein MutL
MGKIKQLPEDVANQISAGEVVERPASVVKELVENSIDAQSDKILIEIKNGGRDLIRIKDNGTGIEHEQVQLAFSRYATSKIENVNDIYSLHTLGFRGEALASIASVSEVEVLTKAQEAIKGTSLIIKGGKILEKNVTGCPQGTDIRVKNIFYNTPARFKYMKTKNTEFGHISRTITQEALTYPGINFKLIHNDRNVSSTPGTGKLKETIYSLYGREVAEKLIPMEYKDRYIKLSGYIAHPSLSRSSRVHEMFFVNKRPVYSRVLQQGVEAGYKGLLSSKRYPIVFLFIKLNPILVDVNVHPAKKEVKFSRKGIIKDVIKKGIKKTLKTKKLAVKYNYNKNRQSKTNEKSSKYKHNKEESRNENISDKQSDYVKISRTDKNNNSNLQLDFKKNNIGQRSAKLKNNNNGQDKRVEQRVKKRKNSDLRISESINDSSNFINDLQPNSLNVNKILGQIYMTYIVTVGPDGLIMIDQHNAHEKIIYNKFYYKYKNNNQEGDF